MCPSCESALSPAASALRRRVHRHKTDFITLALNAEVYNALATLHVADVQAAGSRGGCRDRARVIVEGVQNSTLSGLEKRRDPAAERALSFREGIECAVPVESPVRLIWLFFIHTEILSTIFLVIFRSRRS